jgi:superfamily II DNA helicase RecQ
MVEGAEIKYRSPQQEEALERIMDRIDSALAVVLPTGGGKTLLFTAPACLEDPGVTIVVVPYRQLINETVQAAKAVRIDCMEWTYDTWDPATIVVVSADKLDDPFRGYASLLASKGMLRRVFVDECHLAVTAHSWRKRLVELAGVQTFEVPVIMLTATLPVHMECDLEVTMATSMTLAWIRACTARRTTKYVVRANIKDDDLQQEALKVCRKRMGLLQHGRKMVVYCRTKAECETMASELGCGCFYAGAVDNEEVLHKWKEDGGCMVATSALGTGVNYPGVEAVLHVSMPYGLIDFAQESGRAGRGGEDVDSLILVEQG